MIHEAIETADKLHSLALDSRPLDSAHAHPRHRSWPQHHRLRRAWNFAEPRSRGWSKPASSAAKPSGSLAERVQEIHDGVADVIASLKPEVLAIEELYSHYDRPTTAILMGHARGVILLAAAQAGIPVASYPSRKSKKRSPATATPPSGKCRKPSAAS